MILISKVERDLIKSRFPKAYIIRTCKSKSDRHKYYCTEDRKVMSFLDRLRNPKEQRRNPNDRNRYTFA